MSVNTPQDQRDGAGRAANIKTVSCVRALSPARKTAKIVVEKSTVLVRTAESMGRVLACNEYGLEHHSL